MELRQLEYFREIADTGSINEAARRLNMSQPPLSYQLKQLEDELNVKLFTRSSRGVALTEAGKLLYSRAGELLSYAGSTKLEVTQTGRARVLRLGLTSTTVVPLMPFISEYAVKNPDVKFEIHDGTSFSLFNCLIDGIIDLSVVRTPLLLDEVEHMHLSTEPMIAAAAENMGNSETVPLDVLKNKRLIIYRRYERLILDTFHMHGIEPEIFCVCDDARDAMIWARAGLAVAIFPASMGALCSEMSVYTIDESTLETEILLIWRKGRPPLPAARDFLEICAETGENICDINKSKQKLT